MSKLVSLVVPRSTKLSAKRLNPAVQCLACGRRIGELALECPHCHEPREDDDRENALLAAKVQKYARHHGIPLSLARKEVLKAEKAEKEAPSAPGVVPWYRGMRPFDENRMTAKAEAEGDLQYYRRDGDFMEQARRLSDSKKVPMHVAMSQLARTNPDLHAAYVEKCHEAAELRAENRELQSRLGVASYTADALRSKIK